jgi:hypothetical protein
MAAEVPGQFQTGVMGDDENLTSVCRCCVGAAEP